MIKTEKIINELSKYDTVEELFLSFEDIRTFVVEKLQTEQKTLQEKSSSIEEKINALK